MHRISSTIRLYGRRARRTYFPSRWSAISSQCRRYSTPPILNRSDDVANVRVKTGNTGHISLTIRPPPRPEAANPIIIYLKRGMPSAYGSSIADIIYNLATSANATVVYVEYRLSRAFPYPVPIHTVVRAYDWIKENLAGSTAKTHDRTITSRIGVCGELVGGSLAAMLALTECNSASLGIGAAALGNPIVDWTALHSPEARLGSKVTSRIKVTTKNQGLCEKDLLSIESLLALRGEYFPKAEKYHDSFASPLLFFRTPSSELPLEHTPTQSSDSDSNPENAVLESTQKRRFLRKYPPTYSDLMLPHVRVNVGKESVFRDQGIELVDLMRRSFDRWEVDRFTHLGKDYPQRRFEVVDWEGLGLWDEKEILEIGHWFGDVLRKR